MGTEQQYWKHVSVNKQENRRVHPEHLGETKFHSYKLFKE